MSIGLYDADFWRYQFVPFNLELMKLSTYYKKQHEIVIFARAPRPENHQRLYYYKDYNDFVFSSNLTHPRITYGGQAFSGDRYIPLDMDIESCHPDVTLYENCPNYVRPALEKSYRRLASLQSTAAHLRLSLDNETIWDNFQLQIVLPQDKRPHLIVFHDYNVAKLPKSINIINDLIQFYGRPQARLKVGFKFPIEITSIDECGRWLSLPLHSIFYTIKLRGVVDDEVINTLVSQYTLPLQFRTIEYYITPDNTDINDLVINQLPKIFKQVIFLRSHGLFFLLTYDKAKFVDESWPLVLDLINSFIISLSKKRTLFYQKIDEDTMLQFVQHANEENIHHNAIFIPRSTIRKLFRFVYNNNYDLFKMFYECNAKSIGGKLE